MYKKTWLKGNDLFLEMYAIRYVLGDDLHYRRATVHGLINYPVMVIDYFLMRVKHALL